MTPFGARVRSLYDMALFTIKTAPLPTALSIVALMIGVGPGWSVLIGGRRHGYDPTIAVLTATLIALIWTAYYSYTAVMDSRENRIAARRAVLAGVASELETLDTWAETVSEIFYHVRLPKVERVMILEALRNSQVLNHQEVALLTSVYSQTAVIDSGLNDLISNMSRKFGAGYLDLPPKQIALQEQARVKKLRSDIKEARDNYREITRALSPEMFPHSKWAKHAIADQSSPTEPEGPASND